MRSQSDIEVLPHRARVFFNMGLSLAFWVFIFIAIGGRVGVDGFGGDGPPDSSVPFNGGFPDYVLSLFTVVFGLSIVTSAMSLRANPTPRIIAGKGGVVVVGFWRTRGFAWSEFGFFRVKKIRRNKSTTTAIKAMPPSAINEPTSGIASWFAPDSSLLTIDIAPFVPLFQATVERGEEVVKWLTDLRDNPAAKPPDFLTVRATSDAKPAAKTVSTVVRR